jgi:hypothetical protein
LLTQKVVEVTFWSLTTKQRDDMGTVQNGYLKQLKTTNTKWLQGGHQAWKDRGILEVLVSI